MTPRPAPSFLSALRGGPERRQGVLLLALLLLLLPLGPFQLHPPIGWVDPGLYIRWFLEPAPALAPGGGDYHSARAPFVVAGRLLHALFGPVAGQAALVLLFQALALVGIHALTGAVVRRAALRAVLTASVALNPVWLAAIARGYVDGPCMAFGLLGLALLLRLPGWRGALGAGACGMLAFLTHPFGGGLALLGLAAAFWVLGRAQGDLALRALSAAGGGLAALLLTGLAAVAAGFPFLFFAPALGRMAQGLASAGPTPFNLPLAEWLPGAVRVALFPAAAWLALAGWLGARGGPPAPRAMAAAAAAMIAPLLGMDLVWRGFAAQFAFYASYAWLALVPGLALLAAQAEARGRLPAWAALPPLAAGLALGWLLPLELREAPLLGWIGWGVALLALAGGVLARALARPGAALLAVLALLAAAGAFTRDTASVFARPGEADFAAQQRLLAEFRGFLARSGGLAPPPLLWLSREGLSPPPGGTHALAFAGESLRLNAVDSLAASLGWDALALGFHMPALAPGFRWERLSGQPPGERRDILLLCPEAEACAAGRALLQRLGLRPEPVAEARLEAPGAARLRVERLRLAFPREEEAPGAEQAAHVLATVLGAPPALEHFACTEAGAQRLCRALIRREGGGLEARRLQFERLGRLALPQGVGPAEPALAALDPALAALLCRAELRRIGFWLDRPEAGAGFAAMARAQAEQGPVACLEAGAALARGFDLDWRPGHLPRPAMGCEIELAAARALAGALTGGLADARVAAELAEAEAAARRNDAPGCVIGAARVRAAWLARFGLAPAR
ncbi:hypothetical protein [Rubritepida flocculans]|uniref:hypothetical protein n=1 Tax=Rubritepida flocculans TaxID=182403 RepID=UPI000416BF6D|nr:hypothetical protein [Rubritepida flocculans]